jgi:hypothetical protein
MDTHGIGTAVVSISAPDVYFSGSDRRSSIARDLARHTNETCAGLMGDHPRRFGAFATLPLPDCIHDLHCGDRWVAQKADNPHETHETEAA